MPRSPPALTLVQYTTAIHSALMECDGDWSDPRVEQALTAADLGHVRSLHGDDPMINRQQELTCIQNMRTRLRDQYCFDYGNDDSRLASYLSTTELTTDEQKTFTNMTQSRRLQAVRFEPYNNIPDEMWGGHQWRKLGCPAALSRDRTELRMAVEREKYPIVFDVQGLHDAIVHVATELVTELEESPVLDDPRSRRSLARLMSLSLYGLGSCRSKDLVPGHASTVGGELAANIDEVCEYHASGTIRFMHISKTNTGLKLWRIALFPRVLCDRILGLLRARFDDIAAITARDANWITHALPTNRTAPPAYQGIDIDRYALPDGCSLSPYSFKHLSVSLLPHLYRVSTVHLLRTDILATQMGHVDFNRRSVASYCTWEVREEQTVLPAKTVQLNAAGLYVTDTQILRRPAPPPPPNDENVPTPTTTRKRKIC